MSRDCKECTTIAEELAELAVRLRARGVPSIGIACVVETHDAMHVAGHETLAEQNRASAALHCASGSVAKNGIDSKPDAIGDARGRA